MVVIWSNKAKLRVRQIFEFYVQKSYNAASKLVLDIESAGNSLSKFPQMAAIEPILSELPKTYRALVIRDNYKVIYYIDNDKNKINIVTVWDCRQDDKKLKNEVIKK
ncbi:type II toxin-antitoxin system RelE/ParE family toxin [Dysgonomonas termitidis]|uniref:Type II toxin-antitoxin system RelE/ParE family toxin n=1 Tax=Dysgonomonas termitidis TaxID=1516126 RepID=A0ABV9KVL6_9BACT